MHFYGGEGAGHAPRGEVRTDITVHEPTVCRAAHSASNTHETVLLRAGEQGRGRRICLSTTSAETTTNIYAEDALPVPYSLYGWSSPTRCLRNAGIPTFPVLHVLALGRLQMRSQPTTEQTKGRPRG